MSELETTETPSKFRRGIHVPVAEIEARVARIDVARTVRMVWVTLPFVVCYALAWLVTRFVAACQEGWAAGRGR